MIKNFLKPLFLIFLLSCANPQPEGNSDSSQSQNPQAEGESGLSSSQNLSQTQAGPRQIDENEKNLLINNLNQFKNRLSSSGLPESETEYSQTIRESKSQLLKQIETLKTLAMAGKEPAKILYAKFSVIQRKIPLLYQINDRNNKLSKLSQARLNPQSSPMSSEDIAEVKNSLKIEIQNLISQLQSLI